MKNMILTENSSLKIITEISKDNNIYNLINNYLNHMVIECHKLEDIANNFNINKDTSILFDGYLELLRH